MVERSLWTRFPPLCPDVCSRQLNNRPDAVYVGLLGCRGQVQGSESHRPGRWNRESELRNGGGCSGYGIALAMGCSERKSFWSIGPSASCARPTPTDRPIHAQNPTSLSTQMEMIKGDQPRPRVETAICIRSQLSPPS